MTASPKAGRYELVEEIGHGAMGVVYRANDPVIGRPVAVKTMRLANPGNGLSHEELLSRSQTEARAAGRLTHPNIVVVYDAGEDDGVLYITMELVEGPSLQALLETRQIFPLPRILRVMEQACSALDYAHQHKIIHRDVKPANLMLTADDTLKITDFGTAKILQFGTMQTAQTIGTPSYMSPEQIKGRPVDGRSDIFSLGVVLYELVTGQKPFPGDSVTTVIYKIVNENPVPPRELDSSIHPGLSYVITKALAKPVEERFQSCREFLEALQNYVKYRDANAEATVVLPQPALSGVAAMATERMSAARGNANPAHVPPSGRAQHPSILSAARAKSRGPAWLVVILLAVIGVTGYQVFPALQEVWQRSQPDRTAAENVLRSAKLTAKTAPSEAPTAPAAEAPDGTQQAAGPDTSDEAKPQTQTLPPTAASPTETNGNASARPEETTPVASRAADSPKTADVSNTAPAASTGSTASSTRQNPVPVKETVAPANPNQRAVGLTEETNASVSAAPYKPSRIPPTPVAAAWQARISRILVQSGIDGQVRAAASGNTITLTGALRLPAHRRLLDRLQDVPDRIQIVDDIDFAVDQAPGAPTDAPNVASRSQDRLPQR